MLTQALIPGKKQEHGFSYIEVVVAVVIISLALVPAIKAITESIAVSRGQRQLVAGTYGVMSKMEFVLAQPYGNLAGAAAAAGGKDNPTTYSDPAGAQDRRLVYLAPYDGNNGDSDNDPFTGGDPGLLWVKVELEDKALAIESMVSHY
jgi:type II secretory pathway component PulJ